MNRGSFGGLLENYTMPQGWHMHDWAAGWGSGFMIVPLLFWIAVIVGVAILIQKLSAGYKGDQHGSRALDALSERYAKGEIDREEYLRRRDDIRGA